MNRKAEILIKRSALAAGLNHNLNRNLNLACQVHITMPARKRKQAFHKPSSFSSFSSVSFPRHFQPHFHKRFGIQPRLFPQELLTAH